MKAITLD